MQPKPTPTPADAVREIMARVANGYQMREDFPPFALASWDDRNRYFAWIRKIAQEYIDELEAPNA